MKKDTPLAFRIPSELKKNLHQIADREARSISQICEILLTIGALAYEKEGSKYLHRFLDRQKESGDYRSDAGAEQISNSAEWLIGFGRELWRESIIESLRSGALYSPNNKADQKLSIRERLLAAQKSQSDLKRNHLGIEYLSALLQEAKRNIDSEGYISKKVQDVLLYTTGLCGYFFVNICLEGERSMESGKDAATGKAIEEIEGEENAPTEQRDEEAVWHGS